MTATTSILCDTCKEDIQYTGNVEDYRLVISSERKAPWYTKDGLPGGAVTDMAIDNPAPKRLHFCDWTCLATWVAEHTKAWA